MRRAFLTAALLLVASAAAYAGPPYLTDDPDPVPLHHWEAYIFSTRDATRDTDTIDGPAVEVNNGIAPNTQLHLIVPYASSSQTGSSAQGIGDTELGVKYRFLTETRDRPEVGTFPQLELPTGDQSRGLGNGRTWVKVPIWLQKSWGAWTADTGGGYAYNPAPGQRNYWYGGALLQRTLSVQLSLGGELFLQGAQTDAPQPMDAGQQASSSGIEVAGTRSSALWNVGGTYNFTPDFSLLFSAGHSFQGDGNTVMYLGLYRTWGPGAP